jgi:predicted nucleic acid-binding protein
MKIKRIDIGIKELKESLGDFVRTWGKLEAGEKVKKEEGIYFESIDTMRAILRPLLLELVFGKTVKVRPAAARGLCSDADDEKFISAALAGQATFLVTKNKKHFPQEVSSIKIVTLRECLIEIERLRHEAI